MARYIDKQIAQRALHLFANTAYFLFKSEDIFEAESPDL